MSFLFVYCINWFFSFLHLTSYQRKYRASEKTNKDVNSSLQSFKQKADRQEMPFGNT